MRNRNRIAASAAAIALVAGVAAGCGGSSDAEVTTTVTTDSAATTAPATTAPATTGTASAPSTTAAVTVGEDRLPPQDALPGLKVGSLQQLASAQAFVDALYQTGDPSKPRAVSRLGSAGYAGGALRDQVGEDPAQGIALFRTYAVQLRDEAAAQSEVDDAVQEVKDQTSAPTNDLDVGDLPGGRGLRVEVDQGGVKGKVVFVTFAAGPYVYGLQGVSTDDAALPQDAIIGAARDLYEKVTAAP